MTTLHEYFCPECASTRIAFDAFVIWNPESAAWDVDDVFENAICHDCGFQSDDMPLREVREVTA